MCVVFLINRIVNVLCRNQTMELHRAVAHTYKKKTSMLSRLVGRGGMVYRPMDLPPFHRYRSVSRRNNEPAVHRHHVLYYYLLASSERQEKATHYYYNRLVPYNVDYNSNKNAS